MAIMRVAVLCTSFVGIASSLAAGQAPATYVYCYAYAAGGPQYYSTPFDALVPESFAEGRLSFLKHLEQNTISRDW